MAKKIAPKKKAVKKPVKGKVVAAKPAKKAAKAAPKKAVARKPAAAAKKAASPKKPTKVTSSPAKPAGKKAVGKADVDKAPKKGAEKAAAAAKIKAAAPIAKAKVEKAAKKEKRAAVKVDEPEAVVVVEELEASVEEEESDEVVLTDAEGRRYCRVKDCDQLASVDGYCRYHYLLYWKRIQVRKKILTEGKLERYIEELTARYPDKFLDMLRKDLRSDKEFLAAIAELEIDESASENEFEDEAQTYIDEVRGMGEPTARDEEDF